MASVKLDIFAQPAVLDLDQTDPLIIKLHLLLKHTSPITFRANESPFFDGRILYDGGLVFTDVASGEVAQRNSKDVCTFGLDHYLTVDTIGSYVTLHPGREEVIETRIKISNLDQGLRDLMYPGETRHLWHGTRGLKDGVEYEIGLSAKKISKVCAEGTKEQLLRDLAPNATIEQAAISDGVPCFVARAARFRVKRSDESGRQDGI